MDFLRETLLAHYLIALKYLQIKQKSLNLGIDIFIFSRSSRIAFLFTWEITAILANHINNMYNNKGKQGAQEDSSNQFNA